VERCSISPYGLVNNNQIIQIVLLASEKFVCVMVRKTIHKISLKQVQRMRKMKFLWKKGRPINTNNVCTSSDGIQMNDSQILVAIGLIFWFYHPQPCIFVRFSSNCRVPVDESTWVMGISKCKRKEEKNTTDHHASHPRKLWISLNKYGIVTWCCPSPYWGGMNAFSIHSTSTTEVTGCIKSSHR